MTSENKNKENIISENHPEESKNFGEERIKDKKNSDEGKPIHNYPYEFYEENKNKIELKQNDSQTKDENKLDKKEIIKEEEPKIQNMKENVENNIELESIQINKNEAAQKDIKNKMIKDDEKKFNKDNQIIMEENNIMKENEIKKEVIKEVNKEKEKKIINEPKKKVIKEAEKKINKDIAKEKKKEIKEEKKVIKKDEKEKKPLKEREKKSIKEEEKKFDKKEYIEKLRNSQKKDDNIRKIVLKNMDKKELDTPLPPREEYIPPKVKVLKSKNESNDNKKISDKKPSNHIQKTKITQQTENNYNLMIQQLKNKDYKTAEDHVIKNLINSDNKILYRQNDNKIDNNKRKELIENFLQRNQEEINSRQNNKKTVNDRLKIVDENSKKRMYFSNKEDEQDYFDDFYNKQIEFKNKNQINLDRLAQQLNAEKEKNYIPEPKNKTNLNYFKNKSIVELSKYKKDNKLKQENNKETEPEKNNNIQLRAKKPNNNNNKTTNNQNQSGKNSTKKLNESKNDNAPNKIKPKLSRKEIDELTNKLHYEGELLKVRKQTKISEDFANNPNYHNFSKDKLSRASLIILIKKFIYEYSTSVKNNTYIDCIKNPKLNYDQYIDILKDLYYLEKDALPEDYLEDDTMYKELWDKLTKFSKGPENSLESNVLLLYILELNGFFRNEKIIKELETEIHWIKLEDYEALIANSKYIEENWDDLKLKKIENIKKLKSLKKYNPIHNEEIFNNNNNVNSNTNINMNSINFNDSNHYITIIKGNTNYELIHGYSTKKKNGENDSFSELIDAKNGVTNYNSLTMSNNINKNNKNRITLQDGYNEIILKKKSDIENIKQREEQKLKDICTFKPSITYMNKKIFKNNTKVDLPKHRLNKSVNLHNGKNRNNEQNNSNNDNKTFKLRKNNSNLQKMFDFNPLKDDKIFNERVQILKNVKSNEINDDNYMIVPMRFNIDYPSKFEGIGLTINRDSSLRQFAPNIIFYNIKVNDKIRTLKYIEGDDLKLNVINFVKKNKLPDEVVNIILKKIKEKELEEKMNN